MARVRPVHLVIVDAYDECEMYAEAFRDEGLKVTTARTAAEGLSSIRAQTPDLIIQGVRLPDVAGTELARELKSSPRTKDTPLVILTGFSDEANLQKIREAGCDAIVVKPCLPADLLREVRRLLASRRLRPVRTSPVRTIVARKDLRVSKTRH